MSRARSCVGHRFAALTFSGVPVLGRWRCRHCRLKVSTRQAAEALEGQPA